MPKKLILPLAIISLVATTVLFLSNFIEYFWLYYYGPNYFFDVIFENLFFLLPSVLSIILVLFVKIKKKFQIISIILSVLLFINLIQALGDNRGLTGLIFQLPSLLILVYLFAVTPSKNNKQVFQIIFLILAVATFIYEFSISLNYDTFIGAAFYSILYLISSYFYIFILIEAKTLDDQEIPFFNQNIGNKNNPSNTNIALNIILSIVTFGIYFYVWIYKIAKTLKNVNPNSQDPAVSVILAIFVPFYTIYWLYKISSDMNDLYQKRNGQEAISVILIVLFSVFSLSLISLVLIEDSLSTSVLKMKNGDPIFVKPTQSNSPTNTNDIFKQIELLSELYKKGAISEQEYLNKKEELLKRI